MPIPATQLKVGMHIVHNGELHRVNSVMHVTPGNWRGMVQTKLIKVSTGSQVEHRFSSSDKVDRAEMEQHDLQFLYRSGDEFTFMNQESYEMHSLSGETLGENAKYLQENMVIVADYYNGGIVGIEVPMTLVFKIAECDPPMRGATASGGPKQAVLENGLTVKVPQHLNVGDLIKIDTRDDSFVERVTG